MQRRACAHAFCLAGDGPSKKLNLSLVVVLHIVEHGSGMIGWSTNLVHFPGIFGQRDTHGLGHLLPFLDQIVQQPPQIAEARFLGECGTVRKSGQRAHSIHRGVEDQLGPLRRARVLEGNCFQTRGHD